MSSFKEILLKEILLFIAVVIVSCTGEKNNSRGITNEMCDAITFTALQKDILGVNINNLPNLNCYVSQDTTLEGDEGISWIGKAYYFKNKLAFIAETSWDDTEKISRITIVSPVVKEDDVYVGQTFKNIRHMISENIPSGPDGYLFVAFKSKPENIFIELDISDYPEESPLFYGVVELDKIDDNLSVASIVIR